MKLLDEDRFEGRFRDGVHAVDTSDLMRRMVKEDLLKFDGTRLFPERYADRFAVIVGTALNPSRTQEVQGITTRTLWGNIAAQLGGQDGYEIVKAADQKSVAPGTNDLITLLNAFGPAIVLIDELVAYTRNIYGVNGLPAGSFDANLTFVQSLTEAVKNAERSQLVASIPESDIEIGGAAGQAALERISTPSVDLKAFGDPLRQTKGLKLYGDGCSHPSKIKPSVIQSAERSPNYTTKTPQTSQLNAVKHRISIASDGRIPSTLNSLTDSMKTGHPLRASRKRGACYA